MRWMNSDVQLDNLSATAPSDVYGSKIRSQEYVFSGSYEQPVTTLVDPEAHPRPGTGGFALSPRHVSSAVSSPERSAYPVRRSERNACPLQPTWSGSITCRSPSLLLLTAGYQFREQQGENDTGLTNRLLSSHAGFAQAPVQSLGSGVRHRRDSP
jgi:vitamin B12 transporter